MTATLQHFKIGTRDPRVGQNCSICINSLQTPQLVTKESTNGHIFHYACLRRNRAGNPATNTAPSNTCPECRTILPFFDDVAEPMHPDAYELHNMIINLDQTLNRTPRRGRRVLFPARVAPVNPAPPAPINNANNAMANANPNNWNNGNNANNNGNNANWNPRY